MERRPLHRPVLLQQPRQLGDVRRNPSRLTLAVRRHELIAGRSQLRLATLSLPTHREVVAAAFRISALDAPLKRAPGSRAFRAACLHSTPPRSNDSTTKIADIWAPTRNPTSARSNSSTDQGGGKRRRPRVSRRLHRPFSITLLLLSAIDHQSPRQRLQKKW